MSVLGIADVDPVEPVEVVYPEPPTPPPSSIDTAWQLQVRELILGPGTVYRLRDVSGLRQRSVRRGNDLEIAGGHGARAYGRDLLDPVTRTVTVSFGEGNRVTAPGEVWDMLDELERAWQVCTDDIPLVFIAPNGATLTTFGRTRGYNAPVNTMRLGYAEADLEWVSLDPRWYGPAQTATAVPASESGGLTWPLTWPLTWGVVTPGEVTTLNAGTAPAPWRATIAADMGEAIDDPILTNLTTGQVLELDGLTIPAGQALVYDSAAASVVLDEVSDRDGLLTTPSSWWDLEPGVPVEWRFTTAAGLGNLTVEWRDAYG